MLRLTRAMAMDVSWETPNTAPSTFFPRASKEPGNPQELPEEMDWQWVTKVQQGLSNTNRLGLGSPSRDPVSAGAFPALTQDGA